MKNNNLIENLSNDLTPWKRMDSLPVFSFKWIALSVVLFGINYFWMPLRTDLAHLINNPLFQMENILWCALAFTSSIALYKSSFPDNTDKKFGIISLILLLSLIGLTLLNDARPASEHLTHEFQLWRGGCGLIISLFTIVQTPILGLWASKGAPVSPGLTGAWAALSSASVGCLLMQFICTHHTAAHLMLWHFVPLSLMCAGSFFLANKFLRW